MTTLSAKDLYARYVELCKARGVTPKSAKTLDSKAKLQSAIIGAEAQMALNQAAFHAENPKAQLEPLPCEQPKAPAIDGRSGGMAVITQKLSKADRHKLRKFINQAGHEVNKRWSHPMPADILSELGIAHKKV